MEENIKILEEFKTKGYSMLLIKYGNRNKANLKLEKAIENLIKGYRELEEELKREKIWRIRLEKENEDTCNEVNNNYIRKSLVIPKSKIKEKAEKYQVNMKKNEKEIHNIFNENDIRQEVITVLQELLEEE